MTFDSIRNVRLKFAFPPKIIDELIAEHGLVVLKGDVVEEANLNAALASYTGKTKSPKRVLA